jgi:hypothetical protein
VKAEEEGETGSSSHRAINDTGPEFCLQQTHLRVKENTGHIRRYMNPPSRCGEPERQSENCIFGMIVPFVLTPQEGRPSSHLQVKGG